jgi:hypothetical protein
MYIVPLLSGKQGGLISSFVRQTLNDILVPPKTEKQFKQTKLSHCWIPQRSWFVFYTEFEKSGFIPEIYAPRTHWVGRGTGTPKDKDEVFIMNR